MLSDGDESRRLALSVRPGSAAAGLLELGRHQPGEEAALARELAEASRARRCGRS
ncbi:MAG: hypothetical protein MZV70_41065 [Desulfobacterales bacterium]|nr:hypothetical protein [Desulfobacterales bacterium]